jgi:hypothetical protein
MLAAVITTDTDHEGSRPANDFAQRGHSTRQGVHLVCSGLVLYAERSEAEGEAAQAEGSAKAAAKRRAVLAAAKPAVQRAGP